MALGDSSPFAPVDLLGGLVVNIVATNQACKNHSFRYGMAVGPEGAKEVKPFTDYRFIAGLGAALVGQFSNNPMARRAGHDLASGLLNSFVATETCRQQALQRVSADEWASADGPLASANQIGMDMDPAMQGEHAANYAYGW
jgi:hypothetical protein